MTSMTSNHYRSRCMTACTKSCKNTPNRKTLGLQVRWTWRPRKN